MCVTENGRPASDSSGAVLRPWTQPTATHAGVGWSRRTRSNVRNVAWFSTQTIGPGAPTPPVVGSQVRGVGTRSHRNKSNVNRSERHSVIPPRGGDELNAFSSPRSSYALGGGGDRDLATTGPT